LIIVWPIIAQPAMPPNAPVITLAALAAGLAVLVRGGLGDVVDQARGHERLEQADRRERERVRRHDLQRLEGERHSGQPEDGQGAGELALVADGGDPDVREDREQREQHDGDQRRGDRRREARQQDDHREAGGDEREDDDPALRQVRQLREEDEDRQRVDEAGHDRPRDEAHELGDAERTEHDLDRSGEHGRREQVLHAVIGDQADDDERHGPGRGRDHRRPPTRERDGHGHRERGVQPDARVDARDDREGDRLGDQGEGDDEAGEQLDAQQGQGGQLWAAEPRAPGQGKRGHGGVQVRDIQRAGGSDGRFRSTDADRAGATKGGHTASAFRAPRPCEARHEGARRMQHRRLALPP